jgi:hypothetical protein
LYTFRKAKLSRSRFLLVLELLSLQPAHGIMALAKAGGVILVYLEFVGLPLLLLEKGPGF